MKYYIGLDLGGSSVKYGWGSSSTGLVYFNKALLKKKDQLSILETLKYVIRDCIQHSESLNNNELRGIGIGSPGTVNSRTGMIEGQCPNLPEWPGVNLVDSIRSEFGVPVVIENDANQMVIGEAMKYPGRSVLGITIGSGIGAGFVSENDCLRGDNFSALELGHTIIIPDGRLCNCGKKGCIEAYASADSIVRQFNEQYSYSDSNTILNVLNDASQSQEKNTFLLTILGYLGLQIANSVTLFNPGVVVIGGGIVEIDSFPFSFLRDVILRHLLPEHSKFLEIRKAYYQNKAGVWGGIINAEVKSLP